MKTRILILAFLGISFVSSGCSALFAKPIIEFPSRPTLEVCSDDPGVEAEIGFRDGEQVVVMLLRDALILRDYINALRVCAKINVVTLEGYIEKLENRLKALGE